MPRPVCTPAQQIRGLKQQVAALQRLHRDALHAGISLRQDLGVARGRASRAEQQAVEWKLRFDALLARVPLAAMLPPTVEEIAEFGRVFEAAARTAAEPRKDGE